MALSGIRIIDLTRYLAGPFCTALLADMGADVIKVESPGGDPIRVTGAAENGISWYFAQYNRNKRSLTLDLYSEAGKEVLRDLLRDADAVVENYRPGVFDKMGFDEASLRALNPDLVVVSINGYGSTGPYAERPSFDFIAQAMSGFMAVNGGPDQPPMRAAPPVSDLIAGLYAAFGLVCALQRRSRHQDGGQRVETALTNGLISMMAYLSAEALASGEAPARTGNDHPIVAPYGLFTTADGEVAVAASNETIVQRFLAAVGLSELLDWPEYADNEKRMANRPALNARINEAMSQRTAEQWITYLNAAGVPCGRVMELPDVLRDPQVLAQEMVIESHDPGRAPVKMTGFPVKLSNTPCRLRKGAPGLGQHNDEILLEAGYDDERISKLREDGVLGGA